MARSSTCVARCPSATASGVVATSTRDRRVPIGCKKRLSHAIAASRRDAIAAWRGPPEDGTALTHRLTGHRSRSPTGCGRPETLPAGCRVGRQAVAEPGIVCSSSRSHFGARSRSRRSRSRSRRRPRPAAETRPPSHRMERSSGRVAAKTRGAVPLRVMASRPRRKPRPPWKPISPWVYFRPTGGGRGGSAGTREPRRPRPNAGSGGIAIRFEV
jgi:hypothetical protein